MIPVSASTVHTPAYDISAVRRHFEVTERGIAYFNHAGISPLPRPVRQAIVDVLDALAAGGSTVFRDVLDPLMEELPRRVAQLVNAQPAEVTFVPNTSTGVNLIAQSLPLQEGDNIILCDVEFPANVYPWMNLQRKGVTTRLVPTVDGGLSLEAVEAARDERTRVVAVSAVQFFTGRREDLAAIGRYCAERGLWLVVDAIQAAGLVPIDMQAMGIHALAAGGQKALCAPPGQGFMVVREELIEQMEPVFMGPLSVMNWQHWLDYDMTLQPLAARFQTGTTNLAGLAGLNAALGLLLDLGVENIADWVTHLSNIAIDELTARGFRVITPREPERHANIVTLAWPGEPAPVVEALQQEGIVLCEHRDAQNNPYLRVSSHCYNTEAEIHRVIQSLEDHLNAHEQH